MDSPTASPPPQRSSPPSVASWQRSELHDVVDVLDDVSRTLRRIAIVEGERPTGRLARGARDQIQHGLEHLHTLLRIVSRPD